MKEIHLTQCKTALVDDEDFEYLSKFKWFAHFRTNAFYAARKSKGKTISMHRQLLNVTDSNILVDHEDLNTLNNQKINLRRSNRSQNNCNSTSRKGSISKYKGVAPYKSKWRSYISKDRKWYHLGYFSTQEEAAIKHNEYAIKLHGEFANLNII